MTEAKKGKISPLGLFCILLTARLSGLAVTHEITFFSFVFQLALSSVLALAAYRISKAGINCSRRRLVPFGIILAGTTAISLFDFKENAISLNVPDILIAAVFSAAVLYSASLGTEAVARFSQFSASILIISLFLGIVCNIRRVNFSDEIKPEIYGISPISIIKCLDIPVLYLIFSPCTKGKKEKALAASLAVSYAFAFLLYFMCFFVLKNAAKYYHFPVFTLFQLGEIGSYNKLDIMYSAPLTAALFTKLSAYLVRTKK